MSAETTDEIGAVAPLTFADRLASLDDDALTALLDARPDVTVPPPADFEVLARRLGSAASVMRALERLDRFGLEVLEALSVAGGDATLAGLAETWEVPTGSLSDALERLSRLGLAWTDGSAVHLPRGVADELRPHPLGLGRPAAEILRVDLMPQDRSTMAENLGLSLPAGGAAAQVTARLIELFDDESRVDGLLAGTDGPERQILRQLAVGAPVGSTAAPISVPTLAEAGTAVTRLLARGLLMPVGEDLVELPREVGLALERDARRATGDACAGRPVRMHPEPPPFDAVMPGARAIDVGAASGAAEFLRRLEALILRWEQAPPTLTRTGGLPVRELRAASKDLELSTDVVALLAEVARAAALVGGTPGTETSVVPTEFVDAWRTLPAEQRWAVVAAAWLELDALPGLASSVQPRFRDAYAQDAVTKPLPVFSWDLRRPGAAAARREVLQILAEVPVGGATAPDAVRGRLAWLGPRRNAAWRDAIATWTLAEADLLGVTGRGALGAAGRALLDRGKDAAAAEMLRHLPAPVDHVLIQGDLTAVAPGPLDPVLTREIGLVADVESAGAATVFRFSEASVRRALDAGRSGAQIQELITGAARGPVPQSLTYLVDDVARRHGRLRVGAVSSYVRCDDPALLAEVAAARRTGTVHLRVVAPTVAVSAAPLERVLEVLRGAGYAPASEAADGSVRIERAPVERIPVPARRATSTSGGVPRDHLRATVTRLRRAAKVAAAARRGTGVTSGRGDRLRQPGAILGRLSDAVAQSTAVEVEYVNLEGRSSTRVVHPLLLSGGYLTAYDEQSGERRTFAVSRISSLADVTDGP